jgi:hypothetical protein
MIRENGFPRRGWIIMMILSLIFLIYTILMISGGSTILDSALNLANSSFDTANLDEPAHSFLDMSMLKPLWEEIWIGVLGLLCALGIKRKIQHAWTLGIFWSSVLLAYGLIQGGYELFILKWSMPCIQTYIFLLFGILGLTNLLLVKRRPLINTSEIMKNA